MPSSPGDTERLEALARKYRTLVELHRALLAWEDERATLLDRALAEEFPGALRELQTLPLATLEERTHELAAAARGGPVAPWMRWMGDYHALLRAALQLKRRLGRRAPGSEAEAAALATELGSEAGLTLDGAFVHAVLRPPRGRIQEVVLGRLAALHGEAPETIAAALFSTPTRTWGRY